MNPFALLALSLYSSLYMLSVQHSMLLFFSPRLGTSKVLFYTNYPAARRRWGQRSGGASPV